ncbi:MAG: ribosome-associated translation inhibitor RaiA [Bacteroidales bacterium]|nr:ribosome-associated translation inhibitor RaiA [Bacteroidales bacterium]
MNIKIHSIRFNADAKLEGFVENKVKKLGQFYDDIMGAEVFLRLDKSQNLENKITEIKVEIPGSHLFAKKKSKTFEESTDIAVDALRRQIVKHKEKIRGV